MFYLLKGDSGPVLSVDIPLFFSLIACVISKILYCTLRKDYFATMEERLIEFLYFNILKKEVTQPRCLYEGIASKFC